MSTEKEYKYLVRSDAWRAMAGTGQAYRQGYLSTDPERSVRVRAGQNQAFLTIKGKGSGSGNGLQRSEFEYPIPVAEANELLAQLCRQPLIEKTRYRIPQDGLTWEVDEFAGKNRGLVLAEVETEGPPPAAKPVWAGEDVSDDDRYQNTSLLEHPYQEWSRADQQPQPKFHFKAGETVREATRRILREELANARELLAQQGTSDEEAVHEARKSVKKARAVLRLLRPVLGQDYRQNNAELREVGHCLSALRDAKALLEMLDQMNQKYRKQLGDRSLAAARHALVERKEQCQREMEEKNVWPELRRQLQQVSQRVESWSLPDDRDFAALADGLKRVFRDGRQAFARAYDDPRPEHFHDWRKRAKDHWYHLRLLEKSWPAVMEGYAEGVKQLEQKLGDDHNLVVLRDTVVSDPEKFGSQEDREALLTLIEAYQHELRTEARPLGERIYGEKPGRVVRRLERYWQAWQEEKRSSEQEKSISPLPAVSL